MWFMSVKGRRYKLWWSRNSDGTGGVEVLVKDKMCMPTQDFCHVTLSNKREKLDTVKTIEILVWCQENICLESNFIQHYPNTKNSLPSLADCDPDDKCWVGVTKCWNYLTEILFTWYK